MARKPKQQSFNSDTASAGKMNQRELVQRNPMTPFNPGYTEPPNTTVPRPVSGPKKYKGRTITAQSDIERLNQKSGKGILPKIAAPVEKKKVNKRND